MTGDKTAARAASQKGFRLVTLALLTVGLASCSTIYRSSRVVPGADDGTVVRVVPMTGETVIQANKSPYNPQTLPAIYSMTAGDGAGSSPRGLGLLPEAPSTQDAQRGQLELRPPPAVNPGPYTIGVGDVVLLATPTTQSSVAELSGLLAAQNSREGYTVQDDGSINIPDVGRVRIAGLTIDEAEADLFQRLVGANIEPTFSLEIAEFNSRRVSIGGAVGNPTVLPITLTPLYLDEALAAAGSVSVGDLDMSSVRIYRDGTLYQIPLGDLYENARLQRTRLVDGDSIFVDTEFQLDRAESYFAQQIQLTQARLSGRSQALDELETEIDLRRANLDEARSNFETRLELDAVNQDYVYLSGEVERQGRYSLPFERKASLADAIFSESQGITRATGDVSQVYVLRASQNPREFGAVTAWHLDARNASNLTLAAKFELRPDDIVFVAPNPVTRWGRTVNQIVPSLILTPLNAALN
nr:polysaccharide biosynthesis/export family protein [Marinibacterium profundimaris]